MVEQIKSTADYDAVLKNNNGVFVDFYADWCGPCKMVGPLVEKISGDYDTVKFVKVNVDDFPEIAGRYGIMSIPTLIALRNGEPVSKIIGYRPEGDLKTLADLVK